MLEVRALVAETRQKLAQFPGESYRYLVLSDSLAAILGSTRGRSSKPGMCRALRQFAAVVLATCSSIHVRWVASEINVADKPSRRGLLQCGSIRPGVAPIAAQKVANGGEPLGRGRSGAKRRARRRDRASLIWVEWRGGGPARCSERGRARR